MSKVIIVIKEHENGFSIDWSSNHSIDEVSGMIDEAISQYKEE